MTSEAIRDPKSDHLLTPQNSAFIIIDYQPIQVSSIRSMNQKELVFNIVHTAKAAVNYQLPIVHSTVNVATGKNKPPIAPIMEVLGKYPTYDRTTINSWEDVEFKKAVHEAALRRIEQAGGQLISKTQLYCELQRDWSRTATVPGFMDVFQNWDGSNPEKDFKG